MVAIEQHTIFHSFASLRHFVDLPLSCKQLPWRSGFALPCNHHSWCEQMRRVSNIVGSTSVGLSSVVGITSHKPTSNSTVHPIEFHELVLTGNSEGTSRSATGPTSAAYHIPNLRQQANIACSHACLLLSIKHRTVCSEWPTTSATPNMSLLCSHFVTAFIS